MLRTSLVVLLFAACGSRAAGPEVVAPDFAETPPAEPTPTPASEGDRPIAPQDQVYFALDSDDLSPRARAILDDIAAWVKQDPYRAVVVHGHADPTGSAEHNLELSARRAQAVGSYLEARGVGDGQILLIGSGEEQASLEPPAANRRVLIYATAVEAAASR